MQVSITIRTLLAFLAAVVVALPVSDSTNDLDDPLVLINRNALKRSAAPQAHLVLQTIVSWYMHGHRINKRAV
ncbi:hypothetical protein BT96DRAFT_926164 [Gymnopus androsaceus JB14]|uniref:Uncharacterized protein n=1 Tax=Gymnopus androsaceus JB14 TaxID=1447944 RepID=A0A6A4GW76_9AGAR|nr:hypothetical protein BT96DRAFT_926164 [Gymnopus androsaceus JB14]